MRTSAIWLPLIAATMLAAPVEAQEAAPGGAAPVMVFFGWDKPEIDGDAAIILDKIAADFAQHPGGRLRLTGHSDRSGPAGPNRRAGLRRAEAVRAWLVAHGVPAGAMTVATEGEERPLVPTEDGVREPQNRRVEIVAGP